MFPEILSVRSMLSELLSLGTFAAIEFAHLSSNCRLRSLGLLEDVCIGDVLSLQDLGPETSQLMAVVDLYNMELLKDSAVECKLLCLEDREHPAAEVNAHDIV